MENQEKQFSKPDLEDFKKKLYLARSAEGESNKEHLELLREFASEMGEYPEFVGLAPKGSVVKGYSNEISDIDVTILFDSGKLRENNIDRDKDEEEFLGETETLRKYKTEGIQFFFLDLNFELNTESFDIQAEDAENSMGYFFKKTLVELTKITLGDDVENYREVYKEKLNTIKEEHKREKIKQMVVKLLLNEDKIGMTKLVQRHPELEGHRQEILDSRRELWEKRYDKIWGEEV